MNLVATAVAVALIAGCGGGESATDPSTVLEGRTFLSQAVTENGVSKTLVAGTTIRIAFRPDGGLTATAGCNTMGGDVAIGQDRLVVGQLSTTEIGCDAERHAQDEWVAAFLADGPQFTLDGDRLQLRSGGTVVDLLDRRVADPDRPLAGTLWLLDGIVDGGTVSSVPGRVRATVRIENGRLGFAVDGCNMGDGDVQIDGAELRIGPLMTTKRPCTADPARTEAALLTVLTGTVTFAIEAGSLTLTGPDGHGLVLRASA